MIRGSAALPSGILHISLVHINLSYLGRFTTVHDRMQYEVAVER